MHKDTNKVNQPREKNSFTYGEFDDDAVYTGPSVLKAMMRVRTGGNLMTAPEMLEYSNEAGMMAIMWKPHQAVSSGPKLKLFNVHRDTDDGGLALALDTMLKEC